MSIHAAADKGHCHNWNQLFDFIYTPGPTVVDGSNATNIFFWLIITITMMAVQKK